MMDKDYLTGLLANTNFQNKLSDENVEVALNTLTTNYEEEKLDVVLHALSEDLEGFKSFDNHVSKAKEELNKLVANSKSYAGYFVDLFKQINIVCAENSISKKPFIEIVKTYISHYKSGGLNNSTLSYIDKFTKQLGELFSKIENKNTVLALCVNFNEPENDEKKPRLQPEDLLKLIDLVSKSEDHDQLLLIKIATALIGVKRYSYEKFIWLTEQINNDKTNIFRDFVKYVYQERKPPYPDLDKLKEWYDEAINIKHTLEEVSKMVAEKNAELTDVTQKEKDIIHNKPALDFKKILDEHFIKFDLNPYKRDEELNDRKEKCNGFDFEMGKRILKKFPNSSLEVDYLEVLEGFCNSAKKKSTKELLEESELYFKNYETIKHQTINVEIVLANIAELLFRSTGMEIHTTQYIYCPCLKGRYTYQ